VKASEHVHILHLLGALARTHEMGSSNRMPQADPPPSEPERSSEPPHARLVVLGASAGGVESLQAFFGAIPPDRGLCFVVVQHLSTQFDSSMDTLLERQTSMPVETATDGIELRPRTHGRHPRGRFEPGFDAVFTLAFPVPSTSPDMDEEPLRPSDIAEPAGEGTGLRLEGSVLIVDDNRDMRTVLQTALRERGLRTTAASDGFDALSRLEVAETDGTPFDAVLLDMQMPEVDGLTIARRIRKLRPAMVVIAITAGAMRGDRERCLAAGCSAYLSKPIQIDELVNLLAGHGLLDSPEEDEAESDEASGTAPRDMFPAVAPEDTASANGDAHRVMIFEDDADSALAISSLLELRGFETRTARTLQEATETLDSFAPTVLIADRRVADGDGFAFAAEVRSREGSPLRLIGAISGSDALTSLARHHGFDFAMLKPVVLDRLVAEIESRLPLPPSRAHP